MTDYISRAKALEDFESCNAENPNWTVYRTKEPSECGGKYTARAFLDDRVLSSCDKEADHA